MKPLQMNILDITLDTRCKDNIIIHLETCFNLLESSLKILHDYRMVNTNETVQVTFFFLKKAAKQ